MVHTWLFDEYINLARMYRIDHIFPVLSIEHLVNKDGEPTTPHKLATGTKPSVSNPCTLFCPCVVRKVNEHVDTKTLNMRHQSQNGFWGIFVGIQQHQKGYLIYVPCTWKIVSSHDFLFDEKFSSVLAYTSHFYSEALAM